MNYQPWDESPKLFGREQIYFEHTDWVRPYRSIPKAIRTQLRELATDAFMEGRSEFGL